MNDIRLLRIYLADHHASLVACIDLARRCSRNNPSGALGDTLSRIIQHLEDERRGLESTMHDAGVGPDRIKDVLGSVGEKIGRLKLNGRFTGYSDLSRLEELEGLEVLMVFHLGSLRSIGATLGGDHVDGSIARTEGLIGELRSHHLDAARRALRA